MSLEIVQKFLSINGCLLEVGSQLTIIPFSFEFLKINAFIKISKRKKIMNQQIKLNLVYSGSTKFIKSKRRVYDTGITF